MSRDRLLPEIPAVSPSSLDDWERCPRLYLDRHLLRLPESDGGGGNAALGNLVHDLLRHLHGLGDCHDAARRETVLENHGQGEASPATAMLASHARRCPAPAPALGHELDVVRMHRGGPVWIATGRLDAVWVHDGVLDVRDYKTGAPRDGLLSEDIRARAQAWLAAPLRPDLRVRVRYEHLGADADPVEFEPDVEDLAAIEAGLDETVAKIRDAVARDDFPGVGDPNICRTCAYRSICPHSAATGEPTWPRPEDSWR